MDKVELYNMKFGPDRVKRMLPQMIATGKGEGINFSYGGRIGNTEDSHRVIELAGRFGAAQQDKTVEALFSAYFENEKSMGDDDVLAAAATESGLAARLALPENPLASKSIAEFLGSDELRDEVRAEEAQGHRKVSGVPFFTVNGRYQISGAQEHSTWLELFDEIAQRS
mmetsp:Transcript_17205/g.66959  ORF Transcript_17205/g.66959 Transcript_17205/m.66959 type:complete len:169 (+) Transcript_17205:245-751(+)